VIQCLLEIISIVTLPLCPDFKLMASVGEQCISKQSLKLPSFGDLGHMEGLQPKDDSLPLSGRWNKWR